MVGTRNVCSARCSRAASATNSAASNFDMTSERSAAHQRRKEERARGMRDRRSVQESLALAQVGREVGEKRGEFGELAARRQRHGLGAPGRAAGVAEAVGRIERPVDRARRLRAAFAVMRREFDRRRLGISTPSRAISAGSDSVVDHAAAAAVGELEGVIVQRLARVHADAHETGFGERVIGDETIDAVRQQHADAISGDEARREQRIAELVGEPVELPEATRPARLRRGRAPRRNEARRAGSGCRSA